MWTLRKETLQPHQLGNKLYSILNLDMIIKFMSLFEMLKFSE